MPTNLTWHVILNGAGSTVLIVQDTEQILEHTEQTLIDHARQGINAIRRPAICLLRNEIEEEEEEIEDVEELLAFHEVLHLAVVSYEGRLRFALPLLDNVD